MASASPLVLVQVFNGAGALDACLASLAKTLPAASAVRIIDDASSDPRVEPLARSWCERSGLDASYVRNENRLGWAASCRRALEADPSRDVVLLHPASVTTSGWLQRLQQRVAADPLVATATTWSNHSELCAFPRFVDINPAPEFPDAIAEAAASVAWAESPEIPVALGPCVYLRRKALAQLGSLDSDSFDDERAIEDFCRRASAMGWKNVLCPDVFIASHAIDGDTLVSSMAGQSNLHVRWPQHQETMARFIMGDPLHAWREQLQARILELEMAGPQRDLFN